MKKIALSLVTLASLSFAGGDLMTPTTKMLAPSTHSGVTVKSKAGVLKFSGEQRFSYSVSDQDQYDVGSFNVDRSYFQVKAYFFEDPKSYARVTLDAKNFDDGTYDVYIKYSYLYLNNILPDTGVELGQVHKPWIDYEEHYGFTKQAVYGVFTDKLHLTSSADRGVNFKTKLDNFSSEVGVFQGEGYKDVPDNANAGVSLEARLTYHLFGTKNKKEYFNISLAGVHNNAHNEIVTGPDGDLDWVLLHTAYKNSDYLIAGQYLNVLKNETDASTDEKGYGYSFNGEYYLNDDYSVFARYDYWERDYDDQEKTNTVAGVAYKYNKNLTFLLSDIQKTKTGSEDENIVQALAWIKW